MVMLSLCNRLWVMKSMWHVESVLFKYQLITDSILMNFETVVLIQQKKLKKNRGCVKPKYCRDITTSNLPICELVFFFFRLTLNFFQQCLQFPCTHFTPLVKFILKYYLIWLQMKLIPIFPFGSLICSHYTSENRYDVLRKNDIILSLLHFKSIVVAFQTLVMKLEGLQANGNAKCGQSFLVQSLKLLL